MKCAGDTHRGKVRPTNEDSLIVEPRMGLYAVLDGMGGANAGDVASLLARDTIRDFVLHRQHTLAPAALLEAAIVAGSTAVFTAAQEDTDRHGMGTTVVACLVIDPTHVVICHVGDSRAYLLRDGRLQGLTRDHTIVEELADRGLLTAEEAERHPYKNVLSRNLGVKAEARVDTLVLELKPGDRLLLCSDGLYGYASAEAIQYLLGSGDDPKHVARDLIELALRGGGGDNVSTIVIETAPAAPSAIQVVRTRGAHAWWQHRQRFLQAASDGGLVQNPIVRGLPPHEALELVALSLCQAIYHDLEKSTGVNVWTFAQNLAAGWFQRGGDWAAVRGLVDLLGASAHAVVGEIRAADPALGILIDVAVSRALIVAELALGGLLAERLRQVDADLVELYTIELDSTLRNTGAHATHESISSLSSILSVSSPSSGASGAARSGGESAAALTSRESVTSLTSPLPPPPPRAAVTPATRTPALRMPARKPRVIPESVATITELTGTPTPAPTPAPRPAPAVEAATERVERVSEMFIERPTIPFLRPDRPVNSAGTSVEVQDAIAQAMTLARGRISPRAQLLAQVLAALDAVASDSAGNFAAAVLAARELYATRSVDNAGVMPLFDALDQARILVATCVHQLRAPLPIRVRVLRALSTAHQRLVGATTGLVLEAVAPFSDRLRDAQVVTGELRSAVAKAERQRADLERRFATTVDTSLPWGTRGSTEW
jgi:protein phosphatase